MWFLNDDQVQRPLQALFGLGSAEKGTDRHRVLVKMSTGVHPMVPLHAHRDVLAVSSKRQVVSTTIPTVATGSS